MATFKVLTFGPVNKLEHSFVDETLLSKGVYHTCTPGIYKESMTIERLIDLHKYVHQLGEDDEWCKNIRQCQLTEVQLVLV